MELSSSALDYCVRARLIEKLDYQLYLNYNAVDSDVVESSTLDKSRGDRFAYRISSKQKADLRRHFMLLKSFWLESVAN